MKLPFSIKQFLQVFKEYNEAVFPIQIIFYLLAGTIVFFVIKRIAASDKIINSILAFYWLWMGIVYHFLFFGTINKAAYLFGTFFILQGMLFFYFGVIKRKISYRFRRDTLGVLGLIFLLFALFVYPLLGYLFGHVYPAAPTFGVPCPTTIFTFGALLFTDRQIPKMILIVPFLWALLGFSAATTLEIREDTFLIVAGFITTGILLFRKNNIQPAHNLSMEHSNAYTK